MSKKINLFSSTTLLAVGVGLFLFLSGAQTLIDLNSPLAKAERGLGNLVGADQTSTILAVVFAILKIAGGVVLVVGPFGLIPDAIRKLAFWVIVGFWAVLTIYSAAFGGPVFKPTVMLWVQSLSLNIAILAALWSLKPEGK